MNEINANIHCTIVCQYISLLDNFDKKWRKSSKNTTCSYIIRISVYHSIDSINLNEVRLAALCKIS